VSTFWASLLELAAVVRCAVRPCWDQTAFGPPAVGQAALADSCWRLVWTVRLGASCRWAREGWLGSGAHRLYYRRGSVVFGSLFGVVWGTGMRTSASGLIGLGMVLVVVVGTAVAQRQRKPQRAQRPQFTGKEFAGTFFPDVSSVLQGTRPEPGASGNAASTAVAANGSGMANAASSTGATPTAGGDGWAKLISAATIEDTVKNSKLRLDQLVSSQTKFAGGYVDARREFSLQALMFAIIEQYPGDVRWKKSAPLARETLARMAANAKVSSPQAFKEAKQRVQDLGDMLNGTALEGAASAELSWGNVIDRVPLMQLLEWAQQENINNFVASKENFDQHKEELQRYAELVAALGKASTMTDMPDATDAEYKAFAQQMIDQAGQVVTAVQTNNPDAARQAAGQVGQACAKCHDGYR